MMLVKARPPTTSTFLSYCFSFSTSAMKSLSPPTMTKALMWLRVNAISSASSARLMSAPFLSPPGVRFRCTIWMACCVMLRLCSPARFQSPYAILVTTSPRSLIASRTAPMSKCRFSVLLTPISMLSKSMNTAIFKRSSTILLRIAKKEPRITRITLKLFPGDIHNTDFIYPAAGDVDLFTVLRCNKVTQDATTGRDRPFHEAVVLRIEADQCVRRYVRLTVPNDSVGHGENRVRTRIRTAGRRPFFNLAGLRIQPAQVAADMIGVIHAVVRSDGQAPRASAFG